MLKGRIRVPGDKSISHRAVILGSIAEGVTEIVRPLRGDDCMHTVAIFRQLGVEIIDEDDRIHIKGRGLHGLSAPAKPLYVGNSGTTMRLMAGLLSGQNFKSILDGDASIRKRPMNRVVAPLTEMGANITAENGQAPLMIRPSKLHAITYDSPVASAQVKSCLMLAALFASGETVLREPAPSRDHGERMLRAFGGTVHMRHDGLHVLPQPRLKGCRIIVPGDISSAAFFIVGALITPGSDITLTDVGINETRAGMLTVCKAMGANIEILNRREPSGEPIADIRVRHTPDLRATTVSGPIIPTLVDEVPILALLATQATGRTVFQDIGELRVKECDRIDAVAATLRGAGVDVETGPTSLTVTGRSELSGTEVLTHGDHRIAMMAVIASLIAKKPWIPDNYDCINVSYPEFMTHYNSLRQ
ncbi:MAG: 3-phosphoshikimate 1-carboxyvinyltransferase [Eubacteriales bacterium]|nr:3-phosphoshikimate 1-carboxyvinyltransferase [Eubacteriales bacterium]